MLLVELLDAQFGYMPCSFWGSDESNKGECSVCRSWRWAKAGTGSAR